MVGSYTDRKECFLGGLCTEYAQEKYSERYPKGHSRKRTTLHPDAFTKPRLNSHKMSGMEGGRELE